MIPPDINKYAGKSNPYQVIRKIAFNFVNNKYIFIKQLFLQIKSNHAILRNYS
jgi:hypothetical protein